MQLTDLTGRKLPRLADRFRPRADPPLLSAIVQNAWTIYADELKQAVSDSAMREALTVQLETLYPASDMDTLERYGFASTRDRVTVRIWRPEGVGGSWSRMASVELTRPVRVSSRGGELSTPAPWYFEPDLGLKDRSALEKYGTTWEAHQADIAAKLRRCVAPEYVETFNRIAEAVEAQAREYRSVTAWPANVKAKTGEFPTWGEIADAFPVTGNYLRTLIAESVQ